MADLTGIVIDKDEHGLPRLVVSFATLDAILSRENSIIAEQDVDLMLRGFAIYAKDAKESKATDIRAWIRSCNELYGLPPKDRSE